MDCLINPGLPPKNGMFRLSLEQSLAVFSGGKFEAIKRALGVLKRNLVLPFCYFIRAVVSRKAS